MEALTGSGLADVWARSADVERRFLEYFRACVPLIGEALGTELSAFSSQPIGLWLAADR